MPETPERFTCFAFVPKGCFFSGVSMSDRRILCCFSSTKRVKVQKRPKEPIADHED